MKKITLLLALFAILIVPQFATAQTTNEAAIDQLLSTFKADGPGAAVLVAQKGKIIYQKAVGMADIELGVPLRTDHVFRIGSVSKQFTAMAILQLMEQGKLSLEDDITKFIPDYPTTGKHITVEHLLTHTSGIKSYTDMKEWDDMTRRKDFTPGELVDYFKNQPMDFEPGTKWQYNNSGYILLGFIIEKVSGITYQEYIIKNMFQPLGMTHSYYGDVKPLIKNRANGYSQSDVSGTYANAEYLSMTQPYAAGSLLSTVEDLYTWTKALHNGKVVKSESFKKAITPYILPSGSNTHYGYGLSTGNLLGVTTIEHSGGINGFLSNLVYVPGDDVCVAILTNCDGEPPSGLADKILGLVLNKPMTPTAIKIDPKTLEDYTGVYENEEKEQRIISVENGELYSQRSGGARFKIVPFAADQFFFENSFSRISFIRERGKDAKVGKAMVSDRKSAENKWAKTDKPVPSGKKEMQLTEAQISPLIGEYELAPGFNIAVTREKTQLYCQATGQERFEIFAESPTRFFPKVVDAVIEFYPDEKGVVSKMVLFQGGQEMPGKRVK